MHRLALALKARGHSLRMSALDVQNAQVNGLRFTPFTRKTLDREDIVFTTGSAITSHVRDQARAAKIPIVAFVHSAANIEPGLDADLIVWGSAAMQKRATLSGWTPKRLDATEMVMWPLIWPEEVTTTPGSHITLVNLSRPKGGALFWELAAAMPGLPFLGVKGWGDQVIPAVLPRNARVMDYHRDIRVVMAQTKLLLFLAGPGANENWLHGVGMVALEAACSGIPCIAAEGPGLTESLGEASGAYFYHSETELPGLIDQMLADSNEYQFRSYKARQRAHTMLSPHADLQRLLSAVEDLL